MSDLDREVAEHVGPELTKLAGSLADDFLGGLRAILENASQEVKDQVAERVRQGYEFKRKAMVAETQGTAREYARAAETSARRVRTILLAERVVVKDSTAALVESLFASALDGFGKVAKVVLTTVVEGFVSGLIGGLAEGGDGSADPSKAFPFL